MYPIPPEAYDFLERNPRASGADLSRELGIAGRSARRYREKFEAGLAYSDPDKALPAVRELPKAPQQVDEIRLRAAVFDIEVTDFSTDGLKGVLLACCVLPLDTRRVETYTLKYDDQMEDQRLLAVVRDELAKYDILIGHNIAAFDENWLNSRLMQYQQRPLKAHLYFDTYQIAKSLGLKTRKGLGNLMSYFGITVAEKTTIYTAEWSKVFSRNRQVFQDTMDEIVYHCEQDVVGNYALFNHLYPYAIAVTRANPFKLSKSLVMDF